MVLVKILKFYLKELSSYKYNKNVQFIDNLDDKYKLNKEFIPIEMFSISDSTITALAWHNPSLLLTPSKPLLLIGNENGFVLLFD